MNNPVGASRALPSADTTGTPVRRAYGEPGYRRYILGEMTSVLGDQVLFVGLSWTAVQLASPVVAGVILSVSALPRLALMLFGGPLADRYDARRLMLGSDVVRAAIMCVAAAVALWKPSVLLLVTVGVVFGAVDAVFMPAAGSLRPRLLRREQLSDGAAVRELAIRAALTLGAPLGGVLVAIGGLPLACAVNAVTFVVSFVALRPLRPRAAAPVRPGSREPYLTSLRAGLVYLARHRVLRGLLAVTLLLNLAFVGPMNVGLALLSDAHHWDATGVGTMLAGFGLGAAVGAALMLRVRVRHHIGAAIAFCSVLQALGLAGLAIAANLPFAIAATTTVGLLSGPLGIMCTALSQSEAADPYRGRVSSVNVLVSLGVTPLTMGLLGLVAGRWGIEAAIVGSAWLGVAAAALCVLLPSLRRASIRPQGISDPSATVATKAVTPDEGGR